MMRVIGLIGIVIVLSLSSIGAPVLADVTPDPSPAHVRDYLLVEPPAGLQRSLAHSRELKLVIEADGTRLECRFDPRKKPWSLAGNALRLDDRSGCPGEGELLRIEGKSKTNLIGVTAVGMLGGMFAGLVVGGIVGQTTSHASHGDNEVPFDWSGLKEAVVGASIGVVLGPPLLYLVTDRWETLYKRGAATQPPGYLGTES